MASLDDCIYAVCAVMIIARNNVHLFHQQSDKLYLCCTFGLLAWTLLSNISQLGLLLTHKPSKLLSNYQCFLDVVLFQSTTKGHFFCSLLFHPPPLLLSPLKLLAKENKGFKAAFLACPLWVQSITKVGPESCTSPPSWGRCPSKPSKAHRKPHHHLQPLSSFQGAWLTTLECHFIKVALIADIPILRSHMTASLSFQGCCVFYGQPAVEILMLLLYFRERKKA